MTQKKSDDALTIYETSSISQKKLSFPTGIGLDRRVEVLSDEDMRFEQSLVRKAQNPTEFIKESARIHPPLIRGALVNLETLLGFLAAIRTIVHSTSASLLCSVKLWFNPSDHPKLFLEGGTHNVWTLVALEAEACTDKGFQTLLPIHKAINVLRATSTVQKRIMVGVDAKGIGLGSHAIPFGGLVEDFPQQPVLVESISRAAMPSTYCQELVDRVLLAQSQPKIEDRGFSGLLLDFEVCSINEKKEYVCVAIATDGYRMHILYMPNMMFDFKGRVPPAIRVPGGFFRYLREVINHEWAAIEIGSEQLTAKGKDFLVVARVSIEQRDQRLGVGNWRKVNASYNGCWVFDTKLLIDAIDAASSEAVSLIIDARRDQMMLLSLFDDDTHKIRVTAKRQGGAPYVTTKVNRQFLRDAINSSNSKLIRLSFEHSMDKQTKSPVIIEGNDDYFKAIVMPIA